MTGAKTTHAIKAGLRKAFPGREFIVKMSYGDECVEWDDSGPTIAQVGDVLIPLLGGEIKTWRDHHANEDRYYLHLPDHRSIRIICFNIAARERDKQEAARWAEEYEQQRQREKVAVAEAAKVRDAVLARPPGPPRAASSTPEAFKAFDALGARAERDVFPSDDTERSRRPSWGPSLIIEGELLEACIELERMQPGDKPLVRLWAQFADPKAKGVALREQRSSLPLIGFECRGFELHAGSERGSSGDILFEAQRDETGWRFGPHPSTFEYRSPRSSKWEGLIQQRDRFQSGFIKYEPGVAERIAEEIAAIEAQDQKEAATLYRRQHLRNRIAELGCERVLDFAGAPGLQMALAARLWGSCFNCGRELTDPISLERGIGPECIVRKIANVWLDHDLGCDNPSIAFATGMPEDFVAATLAEPRPLYREPKASFPFALFTDGRVLIYRRDGPGAIGIFASREEAWAWINAQSPSTTEAAE
jgi:Family of unknown function (DUF6011)